MDDSQKQVPREPIFTTPTPRPMPQTVIVQKPSFFRTLITWVLFFALCGSMLLNLVLMAAIAGPFGESSVPEKYHSGDKMARDKFAVITVSGTIMPPFTERWLKAIKHAKEDDDVKGVLLVVDSPGGLVADSHQIYHRLLELAEKKPIYVCMQRMAASGGYYISMGATAKGPHTGKIYAEPTTWTGSIGVIIPRYDVSKLAEKWDIKVEPLTTGPFKDALSPFRPLSEPERAVWKDIMDDAFNRFIKVIVDGREKLDTAKVKKLATGQVYTADQAVTNGLVDKIGYLDDAIADLKTQLGLEKVHVVSYEFQPTFFELLTASSEARRPEQPWKSMVESTVPQGMYLCSWGLGVPGWQPK